MICPNVEFENDLIKLLQEDVIDLKEEGDGIRKLYSYFKYKYNDTEKVIDSLFVKRKKFISDKQNVPENPFLLGIDFPSWFNTPENKLKIMILGIDPLRNEKTFTEFNANINDDVIIGTPYALHLPKMRNGHTKHYWSFIEKLSDKYFIYLTDVYKTFFNHIDGSNQERSYVYYENNFSQQQKELLKKEIDLIKPDLIITFGAVSFFQLTGIKAPKLTGKVESNVIEFEGRMILPMVHLSASTRKNIKLLFLQNNGNPEVGTDFGKGYYTIVDNYIRTLNSNR